MTIRQLKEAIATLPDELDIVIRCEWDDVAPDGNCFDLVAVTSTSECGEDMEFAAFDCNQEMEDGDGTEETQQR